MAAQVDPNPKTNPGMTLECVNCRGMGVTTRWDWHTPPGSGVNNYGTEVGGFDDYDESNRAEINIKHPHCPVCGSHAVDVVALL